MSELQKGDIVVTNNVRNCRNVITGVVGQIVEVIKNQGTDTLYKIKRCYVWFPYHADLYRARELIKLDLDESDIKIVTRAGRSKAMWRDAKGLDKLKEKKE